MSSVLEHLTERWQTREELERKLGGPLNSRQLALLNSRIVLRMTDYSVDPPAAKFCKRHDPGNPLIGKTHIGRLAQPEYSHEGSNTGRHHEAATRPRKAKIKAPRRTPGTPA